MTESAHLRCDICVIGAGLAGMSAAFFAAGRGFSTLLVGETGPIIFASGLLDLMAVHPISEGKIWDNPWACIEQLTKDCPKHPYSRIPLSVIRTSLDEIIAFLASAGLRYKGFPDRNVSTITPVGTLKTTYRVPESMWPGIELFRRNAPCVVVDFPGLRGFSALRIASVLGSKWPNLRAAGIDMQSIASSLELYPERLAIALEVKDNREKLGGILRPLLKNVEAIGLPAILGLSDTEAIIKDLEQQLGVQVFEVPTLPPGIAARRLKDAMICGLKSLGVRLLLENKIYHAVENHEAGFRLQAGRWAPEISITANKVVLATGRFIAGGLKADRQFLREPLFDLPLFQPKQRNDWHRHDFFDPRGHAVNEAGVETDPFFRPLGNGGIARHPNLYAIGSMLAHQDWMRMKCGSGMAIATAYSAIQHCTL